MTPPLEIRRYRSSDKDRVWELHEQALRDIGAYNEEFAHLDSDLEAVTSEYLEIGGEILVGDLDEQVVAMGAFRPAQGYVTEILDGFPDSTAEIKRMRVDPDHQREGYGQQIYNELEKRARDRGFTDLILDTRPHQKGAKRLYETNGFVEVHRERVQPGQDVLEIIFYRKRLASDQ